MAVNNTLVTRDGSPRNLSQFIAQEKIQASLMATLGSEKSKQRFVSNIMSAVSVNPQLQQCEFSTIISCGYQAEALNLSLSPSLGLAYMLPYEDKKNDRIAATFIPSYKAYIQLAMRSGFYSDLDVIEVKKGEYLGKNPENSKPRFKFIEDDDEREKLPTIGYMAYFEYLNGFKKTLYWSKAKVAKHADTYSPAFSLEATSTKVSFADFEAGKVPKNEMWKYSSYWYKNFDAMGKKTVIKQLISKFGIMSIDMQTMFEADKEMVDEYVEKTQKSVEEGFFEMLPQGADVEPQDEAKAPKTTRKKADESK